MSDEQQPMKSVRYEVSNDTTSDDVVWTLHPPDGSAIQLETLSGHVINQKSLKIEDEITIRFAERTGLPKNLWYLDSAPDGDDYVFFRRVPKIPDLTFSLLDCMTYNRTRSTTSGRYELSTEDEWLWTSDPSTGYVFSADSLHSGAIIDNLSSVRCYTQFFLRDESEFAENQYRNLFKKAHRDIFYYLSGRSDNDVPFTDDEAFSVERASRFVLDYGNATTGIGDLSDTDPINLSYNESGRFYAPIFVPSPFGLAPMIQIKMTYTDPSRTWVSGDDHAPYLVMMKELVTELHRRMRLSARQEIIRGKNNPEVNTSMLTLNNTTMRYRVQTPGGIRETRYDTRSSHDVIVDIINNLIMGHLDRYFIWNENNLSLERLSAHVQMATNTSMTQNRCVVPEAKFVNETVSDVIYRIDPETSLPDTSRYVLSEMNSCVYRCSDPIPNHEDISNTNNPPKYYGTYGPGAPGVYIPGGSCDYIPHTFAIDVSTMGRKKYRSGSAVPATGLSGIPVITLFRYNHPKTGRSTLLPTMFTNTLPNIVLGSSIYYFTKIDPKFCPGARRIKSVGGAVLGVMVLMRTHNCPARGVLRLPIYDTKTYLNMIYHGMARDGITIDSVIMNPFGKESLQTLTGQNMDTTFTTPLGRFRNIHPETDLLSSSASETFPNNATYRLLPFGRFNDISTRLYIIPENHRMHTTEDQISFRGSSLSRNSVLFEHRQFGSVSTFMTNISMSHVECFGAPLRLVLVNDAGIPIPRNDSMYIGVNSLRLMCREITLPYVPNVNPREFIGDIMDRPSEEDIDTERRENRRKFFYNKYVRSKHYRKSK